MTDQEPLITKYLAEHGTAARESLTATVEALDAEVYLRSGGLTDADLSAVRARLRGDLGREALINATGSTFGGWRVLFGKTIPALQGASFQRSGPSNHQNREL